MKNKIKLFGIVAFVAAIGLSMITCSGKKTDEISENTSVSSTENEKASIVSSSLDENSSTVVVVTQGMYYKMVTSQKTTIADINDYPDLGILIEDKESVKQDWEKIKRAYNINVKEEVTSFDDILLGISLSYGDPTIWGIIVGSDEEMEYHSFLKDGWVHLLKDPKELLPKQQELLGRELLGF